MVELKKYFEEDVEAFVGLCKEAYPKHNVFDKSLDKVKKYLKEQDEKNEEFGGVFFAYDDDEVVGGCLLRVAGRDVPGDHVRFKYNHVVAKDDEIKAEIVKFLDSKIKKNIEDGKFKTAKVEVSIAENESDEGFYSEHGFKPEGELMSHYRHGEKVTVMGKEL